jgi:hypothetical protein
MIRILTAFVATASALLTVSCCCTGEPKTPKLRKLPKFQEIQSAPTVESAKEVIPSK